MIPNEVKKRITLMLSGQDSTGGAQPEIRPWAHAPGKMKPTPAQNYRSDDCQWFFNAVPVYVAETGDVGFYDEVVPYADKGRATVLGHLRRALEFNLERTGANGLPCGLLADWNDCLKLGYKGESVFVAFQVRYGLRAYAEIASGLGRTKEQRWALAELARIDERIKKVCWDGAWFIWAIAMTASFSAPEGPRGPGLPEHPVLGGAVGCGFPRAGEAGARLRPQAPGLGVRRRALQPAVREDLREGHAGRAL